MDVIAFDANFREIGKINPLAYDCEAGGDNWLTLSTDAQGLVGVYTPGTEFGGLLEKTVQHTASSLTEYAGHTWRGLLTQKILAPPAGADYYTSEEGDANAVLSTIINDQFGGLIAAPDTASNTVLPAHQFSRYCTILEAIGELCEVSGLRLSLSARAVGGVVVCEAELVPATVLNVLYGADSRLPLKWTNDKTGINHLICLGSGELANRYRLDLYADADGNISTNPTFTGLYERAAVYDYGNIEDNTQLEKAGRKRLSDLIRGRKIDIENDPSGYYIGDKVQARREGFSAVLPIDRLIAKKKNGFYSIECRVKED